MYGTIDVGPKPSSSRSPPQPPHHANVSLDAAQPHAIVSVLCRATSNPIPCDSASSICIATSFPYTHWTHCMSWNIQIHPELLWYLALLTRHRTSLRSKLLQGQSRYPHQAHRSFFTRDITAAKRFDFSSFICFFCLHVFLSSFYVHISTIWQSYQYPYAAFAMLCGMLCVDFTLTVECIGMKRACCPNKRQ